MWLDLREIIEVPGASVPFAAELDPARLQTPSITGFHGPVTAEGSVSNTAGLLRLKAKVLADMACLCDRCGAAMPLHHSGRLCNDCYARIRRGYARKGG